MAQTLGTALHGPELRAKKKCKLKKHAKCKNANLSRQKIGKKNLAGAKLAGANLSGATLKGTNLAGADLTGANLRGAILKGVNLTGAKLRGATFAGAHLRGVVFSAPSVKRRSTRGAFAVIRCAISLTSLEPSGIVAQCKGAWLKEVSFVDATIVDSDFRGADLTGANFTRAKVTNTNFSGANMKRVGLQDSKIIDSKFVMTMLEVASAQGAEISNSNFTDALVDWFEPLAVLTKAESANLLTRTLGLNGASQVTFDSVRDTDASASVEAHSNSAVWDLPAVSCQLLCFYDGLIGDTFTATISTAEGSTLITGPDITCTGSGYFTCTGTLTKTFMSIKVKPPSPVAKKTVTAQVLNTTLIPPGPFAVTRLTFERVSGAGAVLETKNCALASSCSVDVPVGSWVQFAVDFGNAHTSLNLTCPEGSTFREHLLDSTGTCSAFQVNDDTSVGVSLW